MSPLPHNFGAHFCGYKMTSVNVSRFALLGNSDPDVESTVSFFVVFEHLDAKSCHNI